MPDKTPRSTTSRLYDLEQVNSPLWVSGSSPYNEGNLRQQGAPSSRQDKIWTVMCVLYKEGRHYLLAVERWESSLVSQHLH